VATAAAGSKKLPRRVPGVTSDLAGLLTENNAHKIEMMDGHIREQRLP
jgi:hypothetical protein